MKEYIAKVAEGENLTEEEAKGVQQSSHPYILGGWASYG